MIDRLVDKLIEWLLECFAAGSVGRLILIH